MDGRVAELSGKLEASLQEAAQIAAELQGLEQKGVPHYSQIELAAHETGCRLGILIQGPELPGP